MISRFHLKYPNKIKVIFNLWPQLYSNKTFNNIYILINGFIWTHSPSFVRYTFAVDESDQSDPSKVIEKSHINKINLLNLFFLSLSSLVLTNKRLTTNMKKEENTQNNLLYLRSEIIINKWLGFFFSLLLYIAFIHFTGYFVCVVVSFSYKHGYNERTEVNQVEDKQRNFCGLFQVNFFFSDLNEWENVLNERNSIETVVYLALNWLKFVVEYEKVKSQKKGEELRFFFRLLWFIEIFL